MTANRISPVLPFGSKHKREDHSDDQRGKYLVEDIINGFLDLFWGHLLGVGDGLQDIRPEGLHLFSYDIL